MTPLPDGLTTSALLNVISFHLLIVLLAESRTRKKKVEGRTVYIWPNIKKVVEKWEKLTPSKKPKGKNYQTVLAAIKDNLITVKLNNFSFIASILQPFLTKYQTDDPLVPFMYDDVSSLITSLMQLIFKADKVDEAAVKNFKEFDFTKNIRELSWMSHGVMRF